MTSKQQEIPRVTVIQDEANYRRLSEPFSSFDEVDDALLGFTKELREIRNKYRLRDVYVVISGSAIGEDGVEREWIVSQMHGDGLRAETMAAWAYGQESARHAEAIAELVGAGGSARRK
jgi:hypothetical protein